MKIPLLALVPGHLLLRVLPVEVPRRLCVERGTVCPKGNLVGIENNTQLNTLYL